MLRLKYWAKSDIGKKRIQNEDTFFASDNGLFMVADGMGGHKGGDKASKMAIEYFVNTFLKLKDVDIATAIKEAFAVCALKVFSEGNNTESLKGMGTTLSALAIKDEKAYIGHIGDSRIYCIRNNHIYQITHDHSLVNEQLAKGLITKEEAQNSHLRNIITRAIGHEEIIYPDFFSFNLKNNDELLLCTDGLNNMLSDDEILDIIDNNNSENISEILVNEANQKGGYDNITVVHIKVSR